MGFVGGLTREGSNSCLCGGLVCLDEECYDTTLECEGGDECLVAAFGYDVLVHHNGRAVVDVQRQL